MVLFMGDMLTLSNINPDAFLSRASAFDCNNCVRNPKNREYCFEQQKM